MRQRARTTRTPVSSFSDLFTIYFKALEPRTSIRAFAALKGADGTRISYGHLCDVMRGKKTPPLEMVPTWADSFGLAGLERDQFILAARSARAMGKEDSRDYIRDLERDVKTVEGNYLVALRIIRTLMALCSERGLPVPQDVHKVVAQLEKRVNPVCQHH